LSRIRVEYDTKGVVKLVKPIQLTDDLTGLFFAQTDKEKTMPDGSIINYATDKKEKIAVYYKNSPDSQAKIYLLNLKTDKVTVNGKEGNRQDMIRMKQLIEYFTEHVKETDAQVLIIPEKGGE